MSETTVSRTELEIKGERFNRVMAVLIATVTVLAAVIAYFETDASARSATAARQVQRLTIEAIGRRNRGEVQVSYALRSVQTWYELGMLTESARQSYDADAEERYQQMRDHVTELSPFLSLYAADLSRYEAEEYLVQATELSERSAAAAVEEEAWNSKANAYIVHLTLLVVALGLDGLSTAISGRSRWAFVVAGSVIAVVVLVWALLVYIQSVAHVPDAAIGHYARGAGLAYQGEGRGAVAAFDEALALAPHYANAFYARANAHYILGDYAAAAADYEATQSAGRDDVNVAWNLGWTYYVQGRFEDAVRMDRYALTLDPDVLAVRLNLGLALLASGDSEAARKEYAEAMDLAASRVAQFRDAGLEPPYSFWYYLDVGAQDLQGLLGLLNDQVPPWAEVPPREVIARSDAVLDTVHELVLELKGQSVALEQTGRPASGAVVAGIGPFYFAPPEGMGGGGIEWPQPRTPFEEGLPIDSDERVFFPYSYDYGEGTFELSWEIDDSPYFYSDTFAYGISSVGVEFYYGEMLDGQHVLWKVYRNGYEDYALRREETWDLGQAGGARKNIYFVLGGAGLYEVEMYVDSHLVQRGTFVVEPGDLATSSPTVLFEDDFADPSRGDWDRTQTSDYTTDYEDGKYRIYVGIENTTVRSTIGQSWTDVLIGVDADKITGDDTSNIGVLCRFQDTEQWSGYFFVITGDGRYGIGKWQDGAGVWLTEMHSAALIRRGNASNHIEAECDGGMLTMYVNGEWIASTYDDEFVSGRVGLLVGTHQGIVDTEVLFDNWILSEVEDY